MRKDITLEKILHKVEILSKKYPIKRVKGSNPSRVYYQIEDLVFDFYFPTLYRECSLQYRGFGLYFTRQEEELQLLLEIIEKTAKQQQKKEFNKSLLIQFFRRIFKLRK